jgi:hypothetical protein
LGIILKFCGKRKKILLLGIHTDPEFGGMPIRIRIRQNYADPMRSGFGSTTLILFMVLSWQVLIDNTSAEEKNVFFFLNTQFPGICPIILSEKGY